VSTALCRANGGDPEFFVYVADAVRARTESGHDADRFAASILEQMGEIAVIRTDARGLITGWNSGATKIFGYRSDEVITKNRRILYRDVDAWGDKPEAQLNAASMQRRAEFEDFRVRRDGTEVFVKAAVTAYAPDGVVKGFVETISLATTGGVDKIDTSTAISDLRAELDRERDRYTDLGRRLEEAQTIADKATRESATVMQTLRDELSRRRALEAQLDETRLQLQAAQTAAFELDHNPPQAAEPPLPEPPPALAHLFNDEVEPVVTVTEIYPEPDGEQESEELIPAEVHAVEHEWHTLKGKELFERMATIANEKRTGIFIASDGDRERAILFVSGAILSCASDDPAMLLSERLVVDGLIDRTMRAKALDVVEETHLSFGRVLLLMDAITEEELMAALRRKIDEEIEEIASWKTMQWTFIDRAEPEGKLVPMRIDVDTIIRRLSRRTRKAATIWVAAANGRKYHKAKCVIMVRIGDSDRVHFENERVAQAKGLTPCAKCIVPKKPKKRAKAS
jgi:PAS domain S-box-containing protein